MDGEIQLISDGNGLAVIGDPTAVERFLVSEGLPSRELDLPRLGAVIGNGGAVAQAGSEAVANSGRWVKLTEESAQAIKKYGLRENSKSGLSTGVIKGKKGQVRGFVEFAKKPGAIASNPALLAGAAGIMAQVAMQQAMDDVTDYLEAIDKKLDDVLRAQKDAALAKMIGVHLVIEEAMTLRDHGGRVNDVTWSKVQATPETIAETQAYALRRLDALAEKLEGQRKVGDLAKAAKEIDAEVQEWLAVLARCFQLQDGIAVLELDRVLESSPRDLDSHRRGLAAARQKRLEVIGRSTQHLLARLDAAARVANAKVLLHPAKSPAVVESSEHVAGVVADFHGRLGIEAGRTSVAARRWVEAATEVRDNAIDKGADGIDVVKRVGGETFERAKSARERVSTRLTELRRPGSVDPDDDEAGGQAD